MIRRNVVALGVIMLAHLAPGATPAGFSSDYNIPTPWTSKALHPVDWRLMADAPPLLLLSNGLSACAIVIPAAHAYAPYYRAVAERLKSFLDQATGGDTPIVSNRAPHNAIYIGPSDEPFVRELYARCATRPLESLAVASFEKGIVLAGRDGPSPIRDAGPLTCDSPYHSRGTLFAMVDFLERMLGFRFFFPGEKGLLVPVPPGPLWQIPAVAYSDQPVFPLRKSSYPSYETLDASLLKADRRARILWDRMLRSGDVMFESFGHTDGFWHETYATNHPEFFALRPDGSRQIGDRGPHSSQRCYANAAGLQEHLELISRALAGDELSRPFAGAWTVPNGKYIYWWPNDGFRGCACPACTPRTDRDAPYFAVHSRVIWDYALRLSAAIAERWPDHVLKVPVYSSYGAIPDDVRVPDNIALNVVRFGTGRFPAAYFKEPAYWQDALADVDAFNRRSRQKIWIWVHYPHSPRIRDSMMIPYPVPHFMQQFMTLNRDKIVGLYLNGHSMSSWAFDGLMVYLWQKLLWNPAIDVETMVDEFALLWGPARADMATFHKLLIERWETVHWANLPAPQAFDFNMPQAAVWEQTYPPEVRARLRALLDAAVGKTAGTPYGPRALYFREAYRSFFDQGGLWDQAVVARADCDGLTPLVDGELSEWRHPLELADNLTGAPAAETSRFYTAYDDEAWYLAGSLSQESPFRVAVKATERDAPIWHNDTVEIFLCADREGLREAGLPLTGQYHHIIFDSTGAIYDGYTAAPGAKEDPTVNLDLTLRTKVAANRLDFELKIPFRSLGARRPAPGAEWPVNFYRTTQGARLDRPRMDAWATTCGSFHQPLKFGRLVFAPARLWEKRFDDAADTFRFETPPGTAAVTMENRDGQCRVRVVTPPDFEPQEIKLLLDAIPPHRATGHAVLEWRYRIEGAGLRRIRSYGADVQAHRELVHDVRELTASERTGVRHSVRRDITRDGQPLKAISYVAIGLTPLARADFTLVIEEVRAIDQPEPAR